MPKRITPEGSLLKSCLDLLAAEKIWHRRWNTGAVKEGRRFFRFGRKGDADIQFILRRGALQWVCWVECKTAKRNMTAEQHAFRLEVKEQGHEYLLIRDVDELRQWLKENK